MLRHVDCFISPSRFTLRKHLELGLDVPITHIPHFVPKSTDRKIDYDNEPKENTRSHNHPYFLFVGRLEKIKGAQNLMPIIKENQAYDLLIAGDGEYKDALKELAGEAANIKFLGRLDQQRLRELYRAALAVIVPSICYETFGIIIIEAFSVKTPVIVNNLCALPEVVEDSGGGFIYNDQRELISAMGKLANNPDLRNELGSKGYEAYLKYWTEEAHMKQYLSLIKSLMEKRAGKLEAETY